MLLKLILRWKNSKRQIRQTLFNFLTIWLITNDSKQVNEIESIAKKPYIYIYYDC